MKTTLNEIRKHKPCGIDRREVPHYGLWKLMDYLGKTEPDDEEIDIRTILKSNGLDDALWCLRAVKGRDKEIHSLALKFARHVEHLSSDPRVKACNDTNERYLNGLATKEELGAAWAAAWGAAWDAGSAEDAAWAAAWGAARSTAWDAAGSAAWGAAWGAGSAAENAWQEAELIKLCEECEKEGPK